MNKESTLKMAQVLKEAQIALLTVSAERDQLAAENAAMKQRSECEKLASRMHQKGLDTDRSVEEVADRLEKEAQAGRLGEIQRAVDMIGPNMSFASGTRNHDDVSGGGADVLTSYILGDVG